jgi:ABC-type nickel/cobalt efflux system permease component RcnA
MNGRRRLALGAVGLGLCLLPSTGRAHPMGNFSVSHYSSLAVEDNAVELRHVLDLAEIPTFQEIQETGITPDAGHASVGPYLARKVEALTEGLRLELDGRRLDLRVTARDVLFPPGAGGLPTLKLGIRYRAPLGEAAREGVHELRFRDDNLPDRTGWKEVVAVPATGIVFASSSVPETDRSAALSDYPTDPLSSPPQVLDARILFARASTGGVAVGAASGTPPREPRAGRRADPRPASEPRTTPPSSAPETVPQSVGLAPNRQGAPRGRLTEIVAARETGLTLVLLAGVVAMGLGALHALEPGHGKTIVAAYLVGARGTARHALVLGLVVTASHTVGVYLLGAVTLYASRHVVPERLYPWLGAASGILIALLGVSLLYRRLVAPWLAGRETASHDHDHDRHDAHDALSQSEHAAAHAHGAPHAHRHGHGHHHHHHVPDGPVSVRALVALGVSGGIVPCPAALVVLPSAVAMGRIGLGLLLIVGFSVGLAAVLIAIGLLVVHARRLVARLGGTAADGALVRRWLPLTSAAVITASGVVITVQALGG